MTADQNTKYQEAKHKLNKLLENPAPREDKEAWMSFREEVRRLLTELPEAPGDAANDEDYLQARLLETLSLLVSIPYANGDGPYGIQATAALWLEHIAEYMDDDVHDCALEKLVYLQDWLAKLEEHLRERQAMPNPDAD